MKDAMTTVGARVPQDLLRWIDEQAVTRNVTRGECARQILEEARSDAKHRLLIERIENISQTLRLMDQRARIGLVALLVDAGKASPEDAEAFVRDDLP